MPNTATEVMFEYQQKQATIQRRWMEEAGLIEPQKPMTEEQVSQLLHFGEMLDARIP